MRVLMTTDTIGGVWTYAVQLARQLGQRDVDVLLATLGPLPSSEQRRAASSLPRVELVESNYQLEWMPKPWEDLKAAGQWLLQLARQWRPDIVHLNQFVHGVLPWPCPRIVVAHSCVLSWHDQVRGKAPGTDWNAYRRAVTAGLQAADLVLAPTRVMLGWITQYYGPLPNCRVIANGIDSSEAVGSDAAPRKEPFILSAGRMWDEAKNVGALERIASSLPWPVRVASFPSPDGSARRSMAVECLGRLDSRQLADCYARAAIYALPARYEPFGLTPLEAARAACPLVLGDIPTLREIWGDDALWVAPDDHAALRRALLRLIDDEPLRRELGHRAQQRSQRFTAGAMAEQYLFAYRQLAGQPARVRSHATWAGEHEAVTQCGS